MVMTHRLDADDLFIHTIQRHCAEKRLNFFLVEPLWVEGFYRALEANQLWPRVLLNMHSEHHQPTEVYHRLVRLAANKGVQVIDHPDVALAAFNKARLHPRLLAAGIRVPPTLIVTQEAAAAFKLSPADRELLGEPFVIKPAMGYGRKGVVLDARSEQDLVRSVAAFPGDSYLLQRRIVPKDIAGEPAYFRVFFVFGSVWYAWWNCYTDRYRLLTPREAADLELKPLQEIVRQIAALTGMNFFSSEVAQTDNGEFVVIDYVNDQCHMLSQTAHPQMGVPDELVQGIAQRLVDAAVELIRKGRQ
jgi:hypothetical protein